MRNSTTRKPVSKMFMENVPSWVPVSTYERGGRYSGLEISLVWSLLQLPVYQPPHGDALRDTVKMEHESSVKMFPVFIIGSTGLLWHSSPDLPKGQC